MIKKLIPHSLKEKLKDKIMISLHLLPARQVELTNSIISQGIKNFLEYDYIKMRNETLAYVEKLEVKPFIYKYSQSNSFHTLYSSIYACLIKGMYGELDKLDEQKKKEWAQYFDSFQSPEDGYFRDPVLKCEEFEGDCGWGDGWGIRHLAGHILIAYARLGHTPKYKFSFLKDYYNVDYLSTWLEKLFIEKDMWSASNYIMNITTLLQYSRDYMDDRKANHAIEFILSWLKKKQNQSTGMWHNGVLNSYKELSNAIRGAYHYYPLFIYDNWEIEGKEKVIDLILSSQNSWGGFEKEQTPSGACEDIDALDPLIRFTLDTNYRVDEVKFAVNKSLIWILSNKNEDGGFSFMPKTPHEYGNHPVTSSLRDESNLFATWFRTLTLAYVCQFLDLNNNYDIKIYPGYEINLFNSKIIKN